MFGISVNDREYVTKALVYSISWVSLRVFAAGLFLCNIIILQCYIVLKVAMKPPLTPPYLFVAFSVTSVLLSLVAFGNDLSMHGVKVSALDLISMMIPAAFAWIAGTLPLRTYKPALNVASGKDVSSVSFR